MNKKFTILIILLFFTLTQIAQNFNGIITYKASLNLKKENLDKNIKSNKKMKKYNSHIKNDLKKIIEKSKDVKAVLKFSKFEALFRLENKLKNDSNNGINLTKNFAGDTKVYYTNLGFNSYNLEQDCKALGECFRFKNDKINWKLTQETKIIKGYQCFKAIILNSEYNKKSYAWYTTSIPINFGPKKYYGLPGLILELNDGVVTFKATKIEISTKNNIKINKPSKGKEITKEEYNKLISKVAKSIFGK